MMENTMIIGEEVKEFTFLLTEPESGTITRQVIDISQFTDSRKTNLSDLARLKQLAKTILEERSVIKRSDETQEAEYSLEILPEGEMSQMSQLSQPQMSQMDQIDHIDHMD